MDDHTLDHIRNDALTLRAYRIIERWLEWARAHGHLEHAEGIVRDSRELIANDEFRGRLVIRGGKL